MVTVGSAAVYARISADVEGKSLGVQRQLEDCRRLAAERGWTVGREYVDNDISAYSGRRRPGYEQMCDDLAAGVRDAVIVYNLDRLHRRPVELEEFVALCERAGVHQVATVTADIDLGNDDGLFMARIFAAFAAKESGRKSARMRRKYQQKAAQGLPHGPHRAFGYQDDKISIYEPEAAVIRELVARVIAGESVNALTAWLNETGVGSVRGGRWATTAVRGILTSPRIAGLRAYKGEVVGEATWPGIITPAERDQVLAALSARSWTRKRSPRTYLLSGLCRCGRCGTRLVSQARTGTARERSTRRYVCSAHPDHGGCGRLTVVAEPLEHLMVQAVLTRLDSPALADALAGRARSNPDTAALGAQIDAEQARLDELAQLYAAKAITAREWVLARDPISDTITALRRDLAHATDTGPLAEYAGAGAALRGQWDDLTLDRQHAILRSVLDHVTIAPGKPGARTLDIGRADPHWRI
ncbi:recombinase family protein [Mycolicibacterium mucogenicum]|uniref:recombinase family protein n=1 Tax=Mycolicibacterium mucogenicum TaxID=56689 RepID=UPI002269D4AB|nr:recombinase family protein [Mycolicibacterium mucogenicum]MCX8557226.1 recombinase family protein [Mycolicibacterium mucogenicum]